MMLRNSLSVNIDLSATIEQLTDKERAIWMYGILETINEEGTIEVLRNMVNNLQWNDQPQPTEQNEKTTTQIPSN